MNDAQNHVPEPLLILQKLGLITLHSHGLEYRSGEDAINVSWAEAASAAQIAQIRVSNDNKLNATSDLSSREPGRSEEQC